MKSKSIIYIPLLLLLIAMSSGGCSDSLDPGKETGGRDLVRLEPVVSEINDLAPTEATRSMAAKRVIALSQAAGESCSASEVPQLYLHVEPSLEMGGGISGDTRAVYTTDNNISKLYFSVIKENDADGQPYVEKGLTTKEDNWITDIEWPHGSGQNFRVISLSPFNDNVINNGSVTNADKINYTTSPILSYEIPDSTEQEDLIYAESGPLDPEVSHAVVMNYRHLLSGIALSEGSMVSGFKIKTVEIKGLYYKGTCDLNNSDISWTIDETVTKDFTLTKNYTAVGRNPNLITPTDRDELMVIPQTAPAGATMTVTLELPNVGEKKLTASIAGTKFEHGVVYWFVISTRAVNWRYTLNVSQTELSTPYDGGTAAVVVNSWRTSANNDGTAVTQEAEPYKLEYSEDNGVTWTDTAPSWLTGIPSYASGQMSNDTEVETGAQTAVTYTHSASLQEKEAADNRDLSLYDVNGQSLGAQSTANCYVISGPGTYRIPCVYGNTLKLGQYNGYAVDYLNESGYGAAFVDYKGTRISESNYKFTPSTAAVLWQSTSGVVTDAGVTTGSDGMSYVTFTVNKDNLVQGNAVITASNGSGTVMWSWHLWITDAKLMSTTTNFLMQNLGWVGDSDNYSHYPARSVQIRITQTDALSDADPVIITVNQTEGDVDDNTSGTCLYYQWGRKDPFRGSDITTTRSTLYTNEDSAPLYHSIRNPSSPMLYYYYYSSWEYDIYDWTSDHYNVLWNSRYSTQAVNTPVEKSVYDPAPYGFCAPKGQITFDEMIASLPNVGFYRLGIKGNYWNYSVSVSQYSSKYYWTSRSERSSDSGSWYSYYVSSSGYNSSEYCSSLLPLRPYKDTDSGAALQTSD